MLLLNKRIVFLFVSQVSAWGGYVFIINLIPLHVFVLLLMQRYSRRVYIGEIQHNHTHTSTYKYFIKGINRQLGGVYKYAHLTFSVAHPG